jgi:hypothetical protein
MYQPSRIVYISIGNSDDKLTQMQWAKFYRKVNLHIHSVMNIGFHGQWVSESSSAWQNACWCVELTYVRESEVEQLKHGLKNLATEFKQESVAWAEVTLTEFLSGTTPTTS